jgi:helix-turn-helix protein
MLGVSRRAVRNLVARGELEARRDGDGAAARTLIPVASVERLRSERSSERRGPG